MYVLLSVLCMHTSSCTSHSVYVLNSYYVMRHVYK